jgi:uncharacterized membrane protein
MTAKADPPAAAARLTAALRALCLLAVAFSSAAFVDGRRGHAFCARGSGCDAVRQSDLGQLLAPALPLLGLIGFSCILLASLYGRGWLQRAALALAVSAGFGGLALLGLQAFAIRAWCPLCVGVDLTAVAAAGCALVLLIRRYEPRPLAAWDGRAAWMAALALAGLGPDVLAEVRPVPAPAFVRALAQPGVLTVVELSDFECPFCRAMHPTLKAALADHGARVRLVRMSIPLPLHPQARDAARAYHCADQQGRGEAMADVLFSSSELRAADSARYARSLGLHLARFSACMVDPATERHIAQDVATVMAAGFDGLPSVWIGDSHILGFNRDAGRAPYDAALARALHGPSPWTRARWLALALLAALALWPALRALLTRSR